MARSPRNGRRLALVGLALMMAGVAGSWWTPRSSAREPCPGWVAVPFNGTALELLQGEQALPISHPVVDLLPKVLCIEPLPGRSG